jgi:glutamyl-tRNA synthetase
MKPARTRFAPSPTGYLHVGGVRTALFAWLIARQSKGQFILRLEDTDKVREVEDSADQIKSSLQWLGLDWDEGPDIGGEHGPYKQSDRLAIYKQWADKLISTGRAYADPYTPQQVENFRKESADKGQPFLYRNYRPETTSPWDGSTALRFKSDPKSYSWHDAVMGDLSTGADVIDDFVVMKSDGYPTYNFAHIVDDHLMGITHVIRSQEFLSSVPKYLNLYEALGISPPILATLPYVMEPDGKKKLSKRSGAKSVLDYATLGYLPEAMINFLASLGWNDGTEQEIFSKEELISKFSLERVQKGGAHFDERRLTWMNGVYIRSLPLSELYSRAADYWPKSADAYDADYRRSVLGLVQERLKFFAELPGLSNFFFEDLPLNPELISNHKQLSKLSPEELKSLLSASRESLAQSDFSLKDLSDRLNTLLNDTSSKPAVLFSLIRIALTQAAASPPLAESLQLIGKTRSLKRLDDQLKVLE